MELVVRFLGYHTKILRDWRPDTPSWASRGDSEAANIECGCAARTGIVGTVDPLVVDISLLSDGFHRLAS